MLSGLKLYLLATLTVATLCITLLVPSFLGIWMLILSLWIIFVAVNITTLLFASIHVFLSLSFDYYLRWTNAKTLFYRGGGSSIEELALFTTILLLFFYAADRSSAFRCRGDIRVPDMDLQFSRPAGWISFFILLGGSLYVTYTSGTIFQQQFDLDELGRFAILEYLALFILVALFSEERARLGRFVFILAAAIYTVALALASYRMACTMAGLALFLGLLSGKSVPKYKILGGLVIGFFLMASVGLVRSGQFEINLASLFGYKKLGPFGYVLDNTFTGVIETSLIYTNYSEKISFYETLINFLAIIAPVPSSLLPESFDYHSAAKAYHQTRVPGGGIVAGYILFTEYLLIIPLLWFVARSQAIGLHRVNQLHPQQNSLQHVLFAILMISIMRWSLYGVYVLSKFLGVFLLLLLIDATYRSLDVRSRSLQRAVT